MILVALFVIVTWNKFKNKIKNSNEFCVTVETVSYSNVPPTTHTNFTSLFLFSTRNVNLFYIPNCLSHNNSWKLLVPPPIIFLHLIWKQHVACFVIMFGVPFQNPTGTVRIIMSFLKSEKYFSLYFTFFPLDETFSVLFIILLS